MGFGAKTWTPSRVISRATVESGERIERRRYPRVKMELPARYLSQDGQEYDCVTVDFSPGGILFQAPRSERPGADIVAYIRDLGRIQGTVVRSLRDGFAVSIVGTARKTERLTDKIAWLKPEGVRDRRLFPRVTIEGAMITLRCADGRSEVVPIIDVSTGGIAFRTGFALKIGDRVEIGEQTGVVARVFDGGAAARFI